MIGVQPQDSRRYFMLPQAPEDSGYYVYGKPGSGAYQYAHPSMMTLIMFIEREWAAIDNRKFGVGNISLAGGPENADHASHMDGMQVDVRALRKDGLQLPVTWHQEQYDREATGKLIGLFFAHPFIKKILFNDIGVYPISLYTSFFTNKINDLQPPFLRPRQQGDERRIGWFDTKYPLFA